MQPGQLRGQRARRPPPLDPVPAEGLVVSADVLAQAVRAPDELREPRARRGHEIGHRDRLCQGA